MSGSMIEIVAARTKDCVCCKRNKQGRTFLCADCWKIGVEEAQIGRRPLFEDVTKIIESALRWKNANNG